MPPVAPAHRWSSATVADVRVRIGCFLVVAALVVALGCSSSPEDAAGQVLASGTTGTGPRGTVPPGSTPGTDPPGTVVPLPAETAMPTTSVPTTAVSPPGPGPIAPTGPEPVPDPDPDPPSVGGCGAQSGFVAVGNGRRALVRSSASAGRRPAVVVLHGFTGSPESIERMSGWTPFGLGQGAVVAYPEGTSVAAGGFGWNTGTVRFTTSGIDDAAYLAAVVDHLIATACVDPARILLTGESNGGAMTVAAACAPATRDRFRTFAPVIPAVDGGVLARCGAGPAVHLVALAGRLDPVIPYDGVYPAGQAPLLAQEAWFLGLASQRNGCAPTAVRARIDGGEEIHAAGCPGTPTLVAIDDGTHTWPGGPAGTGSQQPGRFDATGYLWARFVAG